MFEKPFIAGAPFIQIVGRLDVDQVKPKKKLGEKPYPEIREGASFLQATSTSAQELLTKAGTTVDRLNEMLSPDNIGAVTDTLRNLQTADQRLRQVRCRHPEHAGRAAGGDRRVPQDLRQAERPRRTRSTLIAQEIGPQDAETRKALAGKEPSELRKTLAETRAALANINGAADQLNKLVGDNRRPSRISPRAV